MARTMVRGIDWVVERETEKAVQCMVKSGECHNVERYAWLPKSACEIEEFVATVNGATGEPETYGKRVVAVAMWVLIDKRIKF